MTVVDAVPMWIPRLVTRFMYGKESEQALGEAYERVIEENGGLGGAIVKSFICNVIKVVLLFGVIFLILYLVLIKLSK